MKVIGRGGDETLAGMAIDWVKVCGLGAKEHKLEKFFIKNATMLGNIFYGQVDHEGNL